MQMQSLSYPESPNFDNMHSHHQLHSKHNQFTPHNLYSSPTIPDHHYQSLANVASEQELRNKIQRQQQQQQQLQQMQNESMNTIYQPDYNAYPNNPRSRQPSNRASMTSTSQYFATSNVENFPSSSGSATTPRSAYEYGAPANPKPYSDYYGSPTILQPGLTSNKGQNTFSSHSSQFSSGAHISSQTPYGPHIIAGSSAGSSHVNGNSATTAMNGSAGLNHGNATSTVNSNVNEEISTIFVVGFPDDMQEREFQNMFTFSPDFEAATLKIPNKESTAYNLANSANSARPPFANFAGSNDPYNLVTVNQGGVIIDAGRDGTMTSWPIHGEDMGSQNFSGGNNVPPRKQIIGFAKFRTREAALAARDGLQGRRVDIEKGAVLKAEMAKKNLHTKRGVGPVAGPANPNGAVSLTSMQQPATNGGPQSFGMGMAGSDMMGIREREMGTLGAMGLNGRLAQWRDQVQHPQENQFPPGVLGIEERRQGLPNGMNPTSASLMAANLRGVRERAEEDERKPDLRLRPNMSAYEAFHSVPASNANSASMFSGADDGTPSGGSPVMSNSQAFGRAQGHHDEPGPWDSVPTRASQPHSPSQRSSSPAVNGNIVYAEIQPRPYSPSEGMIGSRGLPNRVTHSTSESSSSNASAPQAFAPLHTDRTSLNGAPGVGELSRALTELDVNSEGGKTSPQLPSPASGSSGKSNGDQNPPINTLYVGNLPTTSPTGGFPQDSLEESLKELFAVQPGYRRLSFRQKNNGPMCFVEFEDVAFATKALQDLYGNNLKGLVKGGIRLSYSKNPLGVRTPTSATSATTPMQNQQSNQPSGPSQSFIPSYSSEFRPQFTDEVHNSVPIRREAVAPSQQGFHGYPQDMHASSPPPRFASPPSFMPSSGPNTLGSGIPRYGLGNMSGGFSSSFSPFGITNSPPPSIPDHSAEGHIISHSPHIQQ